MRDSEGNKSIANLRDSGSAARDRQKNFIQQVSLRPSWVPEPRVQTRLSRRVGFLRELTRSCACRAGADHGCARFGGGEPLVGPCALRDGFWPGRGVIIGPVHASSQGRPYTAAETEEILGGLVRALILLMCHNEEERKRYIHLHTLAGTLCEFFGLVYLLDFITARQTESMSILQCAPNCKPLAAVVTAAPMFIDENIIYRCFKWSLVANLVLFIFTTLLCWSHTFKMLCSFTNRVSVYLILLTICVEFSKELEEMGVHEVSQLPATQLRW
ncbi:hypothetical protein V5799_026251 [Amblyomma americanum]|uniref:Uncharacterized protein n=1 Tax=Amblyomma americanum TaxID=6943 RepID=A0AAQ4DJ42_AMBAM